LILPKLFVFHLVFICPLANYRRLDIIQTIVRRYFDETRSVYELFVGD
jgi:hypothetical protein